MDGDEFVNMRKIEQILGDARISSSALAVFIVQAC